MKKGASLTRYLLYGMNLPDIFRHPKSSWILMCKSLCSQVPWAVNFIYMIIGTLTQGPQWEKGIYSPLYRQENESSQRMQLAYSSHSVGKTRASIISRKCREVSPMCQETLAVYRTTPRFSFRVLLWTNYWSPKKWTLGKLIYNHAWASLVASSSQGIQLVLLAYPRCLGGGWNRANKAQQICAQAYQNSRDFYWWLDCLEEGCRYIFCSEYH